MRALKHGIKTFTIIIQIICTVILCIATDPRMAKKKKSISHDFKTTAEGKLVIEEKEQADEMETQGKRKKRSGGGNFDHDSTDVPVHVHVR